MEVNNILSCYLVGEGSLLIQCATQLMRQGHKIHGVISSDNAVSQWAKSNHIAHCSLNDDVVSFLNSQPFDYLFSIVNTSLLPKEVINSPGRYAINYHDALLPQYAGLHATSWAILRQERQHGVTWHVMAEKVDSGEIVKQATVEINDEETAFTLNGKCYEAAMTSFIELIDELASDTVTLTPQDLSKRSYFSRSRQSSQGCLITWQNDAHAIDRLVRSLDFGPYPNPLGVAKFFIGDEAIVVSETKVTQVASTLAPGTIAIITPAALGVATSSYDIELHKLSTVEGEALSVDELVKCFALYEGYQLTDIDPQQRQYVAELDAKLGKHESFWLDRLLEPQPLIIPYIKSSTEPTEDVKALSAPVPAAVNTFINVHFSEEQASDFIFAAFIAYISRISENQIFDIGIQCKEPTVANLFASHIPCRINLDKSQSFTEIYHIIDAQKSESEQHKTYLHDMRIRYPALASSGKPPLPVVIEKADNLEAMALTKDVDLSFIIQNDAKAYKFLYRSAALSEMSAKRMAEQFAVFIHSIIENPLLSIAKLNLLSELEYRKIIVTWNNTERDYPKYTCLHQLFEAQVEKTPHKIAVSFEDQQITYSELNARANQLAHYLQTLHIQPDMLVGLCVDRSIDMLIGLFGILKAGGAYLPLDPLYPNARIGFMLEDANVRVLVTQDKWRPKLAEMQTTATLLCLDTDWQTIAQQPTKNPSSMVTSNHLMYVIYTSGSTGKPKGVQITHRALVNFLYAIRYSVGLAPQDKLLAVTTLSFDIATLELYLPLLTGAEVILASRETALDALQLLEKINTTGATVMQATPATWQLLLNVGWERTPHLKILCGGEALPRLMAEKMLERGRCVWNLYGPTETTVWSTVYQVPAQTVSATDNSAVELIGKPLLNTQLYILDEFLQPTPIGIAGELYIGGDGLARGYLNRPALTNERFIPNPFSDQPDSRLYRTGDLVRYRADGHVEYISRIDHQVKIRGFRIEIGEIEAQLRQHKAVREAVVVAQDFPPGSKNLIAYVVLKPEHTATSDEQLLDHLRKTLPDYMVPALLMFMEQFPLTPNGKVDRRSLPLPSVEESAQLTQAKPNITAEMPTEQALTLMWSYLLRREQVGLHDKFFEIGGNSLLATEVILQIRDLFNLQLPVSKLFESSTIAKLSQVIDNLKQPIASTDNPPQNNQGSNDQDDDAALLAMLEDLAADKLDIDDVANALSK